MSDEQSEDEKERHLAEDGAEFGLENAIGTGDATAEVTTTSGNKMLLMGLIAGAISVVLVACLTAAYIGYSMNKNKDVAKAGDIAKNKAFAPAQEAKAKIKLIDRDAKSIRFLMFNDTRKTYQISELTEFFDRDDNHLRTGLDDAAVREEEYCVILPTDDHISLRWLKLTPAPK